MPSLWLINFKVRAKAMISLAKVGEKAGAKAGAMIGGLLAKVVGCMLAKGAG